MNGIVNQAAIFVPLLVVVAVSFVAFIRLATARARGLRESPRSPDYFRAFRGEPEPEHVVIAVRHFGNLFEVPTLFYAACLSLALLGGVGTWSLVWAWGYALSRVVQSAVHLTYNNPLHRGGAFFVGWLFLALLWISVALVVAAYL